MAKYTNARYPDKINDLVDNDGNVNIPGEVPFEWHTAILDPISDTQIQLYLSDDDFIEIATSQPLKIKCDIEDETQIDLIYKELINGGVRYNGHIEGVIVFVDMISDGGDQIAILTINPIEPSDVNDFDGFAAAVQECYDHLSDYAYSNTGTFEFKDALTNDFAAVLSNVPVYNALGLRGDLILNLTKVINNNKHHVNQEITFGEQKPFLKVWMTTDEMPMQQIEFGCYQFSGTITLVFHDNLE